MFFVFLEMMTQMNHNKKKQLKIKRLKKILVKLFLIIIMIDNASSEEIRINKIFYLSN